MIKRYLCLLLAVLLFMSGCHYNDGGDILEPVEFYYPRKSANFVYGSEDGVITAEIREASGHTEDLNYLLTLLLRGPLNDQLRNPFPEGCTLKEVRSGGNTLCITISEEFTALEGLEYTLACASIATTCFALTDAQRVRIDAQSPTRTVSITLDVDSFLLSDFSAFDPTEGAETQN